MSYVWTFCSCFFGWVFGWWVTELLKRKKKQPCERCAVWRKMAADQDELLGQAAERLDALTEEAQRIGLYDPKKKEEMI